MCENQQEEDTGEVGTLPGSWIIWSPAALVQHVYRQARVNELAAQATVVSHHINR